MKRSYLLLLLAMNCASVSAQTSDPDSAHVITSDIERFWQAYDRIKPGATKEDSLRAFFEEYYLKASPGLQEFIRHRIGSVYELVETISRHPKYYASIKASTLKAASYDDDIRQVYRALDSLYDDAVLPDTYIQIGRMNSGGTFTAERILIGAEMYGRTPAMPTEELSDWHVAVLKPAERLPHTVAHELVHYQQKYPDSDRTLLAQTIQEGTADFIAEIIFGQHNNEHIHDWANSREEELWQEFEQQMHGNDVSNWLYNGNSVVDRPADLGYWMGYKIAEAYYERAEDKRQAIGDILEIRDYDAFLDASGYGEKFAE